MADDDEIEIGAGLGPYADKLTEIKQRRDVGCKKGELYDPVIGVNTPLESLTLLSHSGCLQALLFRFANHNS